MDIHNIEPLQMEWALDAILMSNFLFFKHSDEKLAQKVGTNKTDVGSGGLKSEHFLLSLQSFYINSSIDILSTNILSTEVSSTLVDFVTAFKKHLFANVD
jgi:hypothetical protein